MESRFLMFFLLMMVVLSITQYFYKPPVPPPGAKKTESTGTATATPKESSSAGAKEPPATAAAAPAAQPISVEPVAPTQASSETTVTVDTGLAKIVLSNRGGGTVKSWVLTKFKEASEKPLDVVNPAGKGILPPPMSYEFKGQQKPPVDLNQALFTQKVSDDGFSVEFDYSNGAITAKKVLDFKKGSYLAELTSEVTLNGVLMPHFIGWRGGFGDDSVLKYYSLEKAVVYDSNARGMLSLTPGKLEVKDPKDSKEGPIESQGNFVFAGMQDQYFGVVFLPKANSIDLLSYGDKLKLPGTDDEEYHAGIAVGGEGLNRFTMFTGPKDIDVLRATNPKLETLIEWGFFGIVAKPLFLTMNWTFDHVTHNWGWAIVLVTFVINVVLFPFKLTSMKSAKKSAALQPEMAKIKAKYKDLSIRDPKKAEENQEVMALYKKHGINPVGGCVPMMLQLPILYAFYTVLANIIEMRGSSWLWVHDLTRPETLAIRMLPVLLLVTQFATQRMTPPSPGMDPTQQKMMMFMPLIFGYIFYFQASGLVLYWLTSNLVGILSQYVTNKMMPQAPAAPAIIDVKPIAKRRK